MTTKASGGNSSTEISYQFSEVNNLKAAIYYRVVQVDNSNKQFFSEARLVKGISLGNKVLIYPNPSTTGEVKIVFIDAGEKDVLVFDVAGKVVQQYKRAKNSVVITGLKTGLYVLQISDESGRSSHKVMVN